MGRGLGRGCLQGVSGTPAIRPAYRPPLPAGPAASAHVWPPVHSSPPSSSFCPFSESAPPTLGSHRVMGGPLPPAPCCGVPAPESLPRKPRPLVLQGARLGGPRGEALVRGCGPRGKRERSELSLCLSSAHRLPSIHLSSVCLSPIDYPSICIIHHLLSIITHHLSMIYLSVSPITCLSVCLPLSAISLYPLSPSLPPAPATARTRRKAADHRPGSTRLGLAFQPPAGERLRGSPICGLWWGGLS